MESLQSLAAVLKTSSNRDLLETCPFSVRLLKIQLFKIC